MAEKEDSASTLMKAVELIAISPADARVVISQYEQQARSSRPKASDREIKDLVCEKIIKRYARLASTSGGATALAGVIPGFGTAISMVGGSLADITVCMKLQIDMTMCIALAVNKSLSNEDAKHMSFIIALAGSLEQAGSAGATRIASKAGVKMVEKYLKGTVLQTIKELFKRIGIEFTKKATVKVIPFGIGVVIGASANYVLTKYVGSTAKEFFDLDASERAFKPA